MKILHLSLVEKLEIKEWLNGKLLKAYKRRSRHSIKLILTFPRIYLIIIPCKAIILYREQWFQSGVWRMEKFARMAVLFDVYGGLLTPKQRDVMDLYYNYDLSLAEIAEQYGISRQGVHDLIRRAELTLKDAEDKIGNVKRWMVIENILLDLLKDMEEMLDQYNTQRIQKAPDDVKYKIEQWKDRLMKLLNMKVV